MAIVAPRRTESLFGGTRGKFLQWMLWTWQCISARKTCERLAVSVLVMLGGIVAPAAQAQFASARRAASSSFPRPCNSTAPTAPPWPIWNGPRPAWPEHQWDEAVETLRQVMENAEGKLLAVTPWRYVNLSDACQLQLAALPPEALKLYRRRVDPVAQKWYEEGIARRDAKLLSNVVQQAFASSWGDKALMALGEIRLEEGDFSAARWCWERILPVKAPPGRGQHLARLSRFDARSGRRACAAGAGLDPGRFAEPGKGGAFRVRPPAWRCPRTAGRPRGPLCGGLG